MNAKKPTRRQHIVPRWYLKMFATSKGRIGVHDREQQKRYKVDVKNVAVINHFYDVDHPDLEVDAVEKLLSEIEAPASSAVRKLRSSGARALTDDERESVAVFLAAQFMRGENQQSFGEQLLDGFFKATMIGTSDAALREQFEAALGRTLTDDEFATHLDFARDPDAYKVTQPGLVNVGLLEHLEGFTRVINHGWLWQVVRFDQPILLTSDVPVALWSNDGGPVGLFVADAVYFPLDPRHVLVLTPRTDSDSTPTPAADTVDGDAELLGRVLNAVGGGSHRWIFLHPDHPMFDRLPIPPRRSAIQGPAELIEKVRMMREALEGRNG